MTFLVQISDVISNKTYVWLHVDGIEPELVGRIVSLDERQRIIYSPPTKKRSFQALFDQDKCKFVSEPHVQMVRASPMLRTHMPREHCLLRQLLVQAAIATAGADAEEGGFACKHCHHIEIAEPRQHAVVCTACGLAWDSQCSMRVMPLLPPRLPPDVQDLLQNRRGLSALLRAHASSFCEFCAFTFQSL